ncbi:hypothetical protein SME36J_46260 [Serratia marcescens]|nr:hypothetical protein SME36J_46260 [Serratia marcescens]
MNKLLLILPVALMMLSGCGDPKGATESNFKKAAQAYLDTQYPHCYIRVNFPVKTDEFSFNDFPDVLHVMAGKGMVKETEISHKHIPASLVVKERDIVVNSYVLTEEGKKYYKPDAAKNMKGEALGGFCFGKATVNTVDNFTAPSDAIG